MSTSSSFDSGMSSPMSNLAFNLSVLSTGKSTPRRRLSLSSIDTPPTDCDIQNSENVFSAESGCFSGNSTLDDSPTFDSLRFKRFTTDIHPDIPFEAFSVKKKTIAFRRISSQPPPSLRLDSPTDFLDEDHDSDNHQSNPASSQESGDSQGSDDWSPSQDSSDSQGQTGVLSDETSSQDSGLGLDHDRKISVASSDASSSGSSVQLDRLPSLEDVWNDMHPTSFKEPKGKPPKRQRSLFGSSEYHEISEETCSPHKYSPVKASSLPRPSFSGISQSLFSESTPSSPVVTNEHTENTRKSSEKKRPSSEKKNNASAEKKKKSSSGDGFQELFALDDVDTESVDKVSTLISGPLLHMPKATKLLPGARPIRNVFCKPRRLASGLGLDDENNTPTSRPVVGSRRSLLHRSQSMQVRSSFKREPPSDHTPVQSKKRRGEDDEVFACSGSERTDAIQVEAQPPTFTRRFQRCHSETEAIIKCAVLRMHSEPDLIADSSKPYILPTERGGKHQDLKYISPETVSRVIDGEFSSEIDEFHILDCRYPYEFDGGHIQGAKNLYLQEDIISEYLKTPLKVKDPSKRLVFIFHCEFSSERGPKLYRFLRRLDREANKECYPNLHYPEIYLLEGGYKCFFEQYSSLCEPQTYLQMLDKNHGEDLRKFRAKCKSWSDDQRQGRGGVRPLKF